MEHDKVKVKMIVNCDRQAGNGSAKPPPKFLIGKVVNVTRPLLSWHGYWVDYKGKSYLFAHPELGLDECQCGDCVHIIRNKDEMEKNYLLSRL